MNERTKEGNRRGWGYPMIALSVVLIILAVVGPGSPTFWAVMMFVLAVVYFVATSWAVRHRQQ